MSTINLQTVNWRWNREYRLSTTCVWCSMVCGNYTLPPLTHSWNQHHHRPQKCHHHQRNLPNNKNGIQAMLHFSFQFHLFIDLSQMQFYNYYYTTTNSQGGVQYYRRCTTTMLTGKHILWQKDFTWSYLRFWLNWRRRNSLNR